VEEFSFRNTGDYSMLFWCKFDEVVVLGGWRLLLLPSWGSSLRVHMRTWYLEEEEEEVMR
jgi:hypothetical protein